ncbi:AraC family transcriptional regulator [Nevskia sp.]|uniref:AraC family transcriptional regulator n=1 Tax=Nevskia sp. TaxID=1929292 RepID=UPI0034584AF9
MLRGTRLDAACQDLHRTAKGARNHSPCRRHWRIDEADVAFNYGFSELSHFCRVFKNAFGLSPHCLIAQASSGPTQIGHAQSLLDVPDGLQVLATRESR